MAQRKSKSPLISMIAAMDRNNLIGAGNRLPWKLPADMRWFVSNTLGKPIVMGRKTFESFGGRPLRDRHNIVVSRDSGYSAGAGVDVVGSFEQALSCAGEVDEVMVIGGASLYRQLLDRAHRLYLTRIDAEFDGDSWFPRFDPAQWTVRFLEEHQADDENPFAYSFSILERVA